MEQLKITKLPYIGVDEVGRGCLAGPMVVCGVLYEDFLEDYNLCDSKKMTALQRKITSQALIARVKFALGVVFPHEIDAIGISQGFLRCLNFLDSALQLQAVQAPYIIDGKYKICFEPSHEFCYKAEDKYCAVALASIIAKHYRDTLMQNYALEFPEYGFDRHKGYGTLKHRSNIREFGPGAWHRKSFKLIA